MLERIGEVLLYSKYIENLPQSTSESIDIELEFPIINLLETEVNIDFVRDLLLELVEKHDFEAVQHDLEGYPYLIKSNNTHDTISLDFSYNKIKISLVNIDDLNQANEQFNYYHSVIQKYLKKHNYIITGLGINPYWKINNNQQLKTPYYQIILDYLESYPEYDEVEPHFFHHYPQFESFTCASKVQLPINQTNLLPVLNVFNQLEPLKGWLFGNSFFWSELFQTTVGRDILLERSMHGVFQENVGVFSKQFESLAEYLNCLSESVIFLVQREEELYYFPPIPVKNYYHFDEIIAKNSHGESVVIIPDLSDIDQHSIYGFQKITTKGAVKFNSCCAQPASDSMCVAAFHLGIINKLDEVLDFIKGSPFIYAYQNDIKTARKSFSDLRIEESKDKQIASFAKTILDFAQAGLNARGLNESQFLKPLYNRIELRQNPAKIALKLIENDGRLLKIVEEYGRINR